MYSLEWAVDVINEFQKSHARGCKLVMSFLGMSDQNLVNLARDRRNCWNNFKQTVKIVERYLAQQHRCSELGHGPGPDEVGDLLVASAIERAAKTGLVRNKKYLDKAKSCDTVIRVPNEGSRQSVSDEGTQLLLELDSAIE